MSENWKYASIVSKIGKWAWIIVILNGILQIIIPLIDYALRAASWSIYHPLIPLSFGFIPIWDIISGVIVIVIGFFIIKPKFSPKCVEQDWDGLLDWVIVLGTFRVPWMLIWGIVLLIFDWWFWAAAVILIPAVLLLFVGPKEFKWSTEESKAKPKSKPKPKPEPKPEPEPEADT
jgi:hypothetical protein